MAVECPDQIADLVGSGEWTAYSGPPTAPPVPGDEPAVEMAGPGWIDHTYVGRSWTIGRHLVRVNNHRPESTLDEQGRTAWLVGELGAETLSDDLALPAWYARPIPDGAPAHRPDSHPRPDAIPTAVGAMLRQLHGLAPERCPFRFERSELVAELCGRVQSGQLHHELLPSPYDRYPAERLLELLDSAPETQPDLVVGHGSPVLANFWIVGDPGDDDEIRADGFLGLHRLGLADRHADLAVIHRELQLAYGPEAVFAFYEAYGADPQLVALDHYLLVDAVRSALVP